MSKRNIDNPPRLAPPDSLRSPNPQALLATPWGEDTLVGMNRFGWTFEEARQQVAHAWLARGDSRPLRELLIHGHAVAPATLEVLGRMLCENHDPAGTTEWRLDVRHRTNKGRPPRMDTNHQRRRLAGLVRWLMRRGMKYDDAIARIAAAAGTSCSTVKSAYDEYSG